MTAFDTLAAARNLLDADDPIQGELKQSISAVDALAAEVEARTAQLASARQAILIGGSFDDLAAHDKQIESARFAESQARAIVDELRRKLGPVADANRRAAVAAERDEVESMMALAGDEMKKLPKLTATIRKILGVVAAADSAALRFAGAYPDEPPIASAESRIRHEPERCKVVREERVWAWEFPNGKLDRLECDPLSIQPDEKEAANAPLKSFLSGSQRFNFLELIASGQVVARKEFVFRTSYGEGTQARPVLAIRRQVEATPPHVPESLAASVKLPAFRLGDPSWLFESGDASDVLAAIDRPPVNGRRPEIRVELDRIAAG